MTCSFHKYFKYLVLIIYFYFFNFNTKLFSQNFKRIENQSKLTDVAENNGVAVADYDKDNDLDLFIVAKNIDQDGIVTSHSRLFRNNNDGTFEDVTQQSGLFNLYPFLEEDIEGGFEGFKFGASWGDYDNDGFPDLFFTNAYIIQLFHNEGDGTFIEKTIEAGFKARNECNNTSASWFDYNNDGFLDIFICDWAYCEGNILYKNNGDGTFENVTDILGNQPDSLHTYLSFPLDINNDGWSDLYLSNDVFTPNELFINNIGQNFTEKAQEYGTDDSNNGMGITVGDYNNDGFFDIFVTNIGKNALLENNGNNTFSNTAIENNIYFTGWAWDTRFSDFDLDGDEDLFVINGYRNKANNYYFKNLHSEGENGFVDISQEVNFNDFTKSMGAEVFDYDNDGDLDIFLANVDDQSFFYENKIIETDQPEIFNWLKVSLEGTISNRDGIGATVSVLTDNGTYHRYYTGVGLMSQSLQPIHFGLGSATQIIEIKIKWPSGLVETHTGFSTNFTISIIEGNGYKILDINPSVKIKGCTDSSSCNYNSEAIVDDGSCTYLESKQIIGTSNSFILETETYSYELFEDSQAQWYVTGGEILNGQGTNSITVKWGIEENGKITIIESNECSSKPVELEVNLKILEIENNQSLARLWVEALLEAIRKDYARPTIHARNLFHTSIAMYDAWALYSDTAQTYLIGNNVHNYENKFNGFTPNGIIEDERNKTISYAAYRLLSHRFKKSPNASESKIIFDLLMTQLDYDINFSSTDYSDGNAAALGNFIAETIINYGYTDGSGEINDFENEFYSPVNSPLAPIKPGNEDLINPNRWQPLSLDTFIDQSGNLIENEPGSFLSPEWGNVTPFSLQENIKVNYLRSDNNYFVYHDPGPPPFLNIAEHSPSNDFYKWGFSLVSIWGSHLDPSDNVLWDISPKSIGNIDSKLFPKSYQDYPNFYNRLVGGDIGKGHSINPYTKSPYAEQLVLRGDYTRVLAEFWADGPDSETPPGHWFTLLNYVSDHELFTKKLGGSGSTLEPLEWDVKSYFILGGALHDAAIASWSIKGWYDYLRPISAIRFMGDNGQSSDSTKDNFNSAGLPLIENYIEIVDEGDSLAESNSENIGKIKLYTWKGPDYIGDPEQNRAGVGWILAENWWPYQRPTFVTPPFAGYISGHSTFSRAAAEVMTLLTGNEYFPGGLGEFIAHKDEFLVFEKGPSVDIKLQWATYRDASDQCSLSRIWGGIHPPADDINGRLIGEKIGIDAFNFGVKYFEGKTVNEIPEIQNQIIYPNPNSSGRIYITNTSITDTFEVIDMKGCIIQMENKQYNETDRTTLLILPQNISSGMYILKININTKILIKK